MTGSREINQTEDGEISSLQKREEQGKLSACFYDSHPVFIIRTPPLSAPLSQMLRPVLYDQRGLFVFLLTNPDVSGLRFPNLDFWV